MRHPLLALVSTVLAVGLLETPIFANGPDLAPSTEAKETLVLVARRAVSSLVLIREPERLFLWKPCPPHMVPPDAIRSLADLKDERLNKPLPAGQVVRKADLLNKEEAGILGRPASRSCSVKLRRDEGACVELRPGMRVDFFVAVETADGRTTRRVLTNVAVVRVDPALPEGKPAAGPKVAAAARTVTLELGNLSPEEGARLGLAGTLGKLSVRPSLAPGR